MSKIIRPIFQPLSLVSKKLANVASAAALVVVGAMTGNFQMIAAGVSLGASSLQKKPKAPDNSAELLSRLQVSIDPRTPRKMVFGTTAMATDIRDQEFSDSQTFLHRFIVVASHKVHAISEIWFDDKLAWTVAGGVQGDFVGYLDVTPILEGNAANAINLGARMGTTRRYTGLAYVYLKFRLKGTSKKTESPFAQSVPSRLTIKGNGAFVYDPRLDTTVGGSGSCRADDQSTWVWSADAGNNPALQLLWFLLGWRIQNPVTSDWKLAVGKGVPASRINMASFIDAANLCDEAVALAAGGTEARYRSAGVVSEADSPTTILDMLKASMSAILDDVDGKLRCQVLYNDLASPVWTWTEDDVLSDFEWTPSADLDATFNIVRGTHPDPSNEALYQMVDYPAIEYVSEDGIDRIDPFDLGMVERASQCQRLADMRYLRQKHSGVFTATFQATAWKVQKGDIVTGNFAPAGISGVKFRVAEMEIRQDGTVPMMLRVEKTEMYPAGGADAPALGLVSGTSYDPAQSALVEGIVAAYGTGAAGIIGITSQNQTVGPISFALAPAEERNVEIFIKVDALSGATTQTVEIEWRVAGGTWATLGAPYSDSGSTGDTLNVGLLDLISNGGGATVLYEVRGTTSSTGGTGTVDPSVSYFRA